MTAPPATARTASRQAGATPQGSTASALRVGLLGASHIAASRMLPAMERLGWSLNGVFDPDPQRSRYWSHHPGFTNDLDQVLSSDIDAVYISTRNEQHWSQAVAAAQAGKHVLVEKPMALDLTSAQLMIDAAEQHGVVLAVNHHLPASPLHIAVRELVEGGRIGTLLSARANHAVVLDPRLRGWRLSGEPGAGIVLDLTVHDASVINPLFATNPLRATALAVRQAPWNPSTAPDTVMSVIEYAPRPGTDTPLLAQTHDSFTVPHLGTSFEVHGTDGSVRVLDAFTQDTTGTVQVPDGDGVHDVAVDCSTDLYDTLLNAFGAAVAGTGRPTVTGEEGLLALQVTLAVAESLRTATTAPVRSL